MRKRKNGEYNGDADDGDHLDDLSNCVREALSEVGIEKTTEIGNANLVIVANKDRYLPEAGAEAQTKTKYTMMAAVFIIGLSTSRGGSTAATLVILFINLCIMVMIYLWYHKYTHFCNQIIKYFRKNTKKICIRFDLLMDRGKKRGIDPRRIIRKENKQLRNTASKLGPDWEIYGRTPDADAGLMCYKTLPKFNSIRPSHISSPKHKNTISMIHWMGLFCLCLCMLAVVALYQHWQSYANPMNGVWNVRDAVASDCYDILM